MQEHATNTITSLAVEIKELNSSFKRLESDLIILYLKTYLITYTLKIGMLQKKNANLSQLPNNKFKRQLSNKSLLKSVSRKVINV